MIRRRGAELGCQLRAPVWLQLVRMQLERKACRAGRVQNFTRFGRRKYSRLTEDVGEGREFLPGDFREHFIDEVPDIVAPLSGSSTVFKWNLMRSQPGRYQADGNVF